MNWLSVNATSIEKHVQLKVFLLECQLKSLSYRYEPKCAACLHYEEKLNGVRGLAVGGNLEKPIVILFGFDGSEKRYNPRGFAVENAGNAVWGMQFIWPFKSEYIIAYLDKDYTSTIIARNARDYVWIMARTPFINDSR